MREVASEKRALSHSNLLGSSRLRSRILAWVLTLVVFSALGSALSVIRLMEVHRSFEVFRRSSVPLGRKVSQVQNDATVLRRELDRRASHPTWGDQSLRPRSFPLWSLDAVTEGVLQVENHFDTLRKDPHWLQSEAGRFSGLESRLKNLSERLKHLQVLSLRIQESLQAGDWAGARHAYQEVFSWVELWGGEFDRWGAEFDRLQNERVSLLEQSLRDLRTGLLIVLSVVLGLSVLLLWFGERALRPLERLSALAREITQGGSLRLEHKRELDEQSLFREDEIGELTAEFRRMAATLLEREKMILSQTRRLEEQNQKLVEMGALNQSVLDGFRGILLVLGADGQVVSANSLAASWCSDTSAGFDTFSTRIQKHFADSALPFVTRETIKVGDRIYSGNVFSLSPGGAASSGIVLMLEDVTEALQLEERARANEHLAGLGRMSAQIAHEVRNPLHSIGLEAEMGLDSVDSAVEQLRETPRNGAAPVAVIAELRSAHQGLLSILSGVERLEKVTEKYLKLSRKVGTEKSELPAFSLVESLESVLAAHAPQLTEQGVWVDWTRSPLISYSVQGDPTLVEQSLGNLLRNALEAMENTPDSEKKIWIGMGALESGRVYLRLEDHGSGVEESHVAELFKPFFTTKAEGTGLGLAFVRQVMDSCKGEVRCVRSTRLSGAAFELIFNAAPDFSLVNSETQKIRRLECQDPVQVNS